MLGRAVELAVNPSVTHLTIPSKFLSRWFSDKFSGGLPAFARNEVAGGNRPRHNSVMILEALGELVDVLRRPARHFHAEVQTHLGQHFLDLVQRLAAEVRGAEHFRLALLHEAADI